METKAVKKVVVRKQKVGLIVKSGVKAGPPMIIKDRS
jgi:hypothetical protein